MQFSRGAMAPRGGFRREAPGWGEVEHERSEAGIDPEQPFNVCDS